MVGLMSALASVCLLIEITKEYLMLVSRKNELPPPINGLTMEAQD
jgi:hypothetical protein